MFIQICFIEQSINRDVSEVFDLQDLYRRTQKQTKEIIKAQKEGEKKGIIKGIFIGVISTVIGGLILTFIL